MYSNNNYCLKIIIFLFTLVNISFCNNDGPLGKFFDFYNVGNSNSSLNLINSNIVLNLVQEVDFNGNIVKSTYLNKWVFKVIDEFNYQYTNDDNGSFNISLSIQWFNSSSIYNFANDYYQFEPSTILYSINVIGYQFLNRLNQLKFVIDTSLYINESTVSTTGFSCPYIENNINNKTCLSFSENSDNQDRSTKILNINDVSLYSNIFTKGFVDGKVVLIQAQSSGLNFDNNHYKISLQVGSAIPYFSYSAYTLFTFNFIKNTSIISTSTSTSTTTSISSSTTSTTTSTTGGSTTSSSTLNSSNSNSEGHESKGIKNTTLLSISSLIILIMSLIF